MLESVQVIFSNTIKESKDSQNFLHVVKDTTFELSHKKLQNLKNNEHLLSRLNKLLIIFVGILEKDGFKNPKTISSVVEGLMKAATYEKEQFLYQTIYEKEKLECSINTQRQNIKELLINSYKMVGEAAKELSEDDQKSVLSSIEDAKLRGIEMFGILKETAEEAYLRAIEKGDEIEDTICEITKNFTYQAINEGKFEKRRIFEITKNLVDVASDLAETNQSYAKEILNGAVLGAKNGIYKAVEKFKNDLKFAPEEAEEFLGESLEDSKKQLLKIEDSFILMIKEAQFRSTGISAKILSDIVEKYDNSYAKLKRIGVEAAEAISDRMDILTEEANKKFAEFAKEASIKAQHFKVEATPKAIQAAEDAKKLGIRAWEVAKHMLDSAVVSTKEALNKDKKEENKKDSKDDKK